MTISRRELLGSTAAIGAGATLSGCTKSTSPTAGASRSATGKATSAAPGGPTGWSLFNSETFQAGALFILGAAGTGTADVGEVISTAERINKQTGNPPDSELTQGHFDTFANEWAATALKVADRARMARAAGRNLSAFEQFMRASEYYTMPLFYALGTSQPSREADYFRLTDEMWRAAAEMQTPAGEAIKIAYEGGSIPAYFFRPDATGARRPTLILNNGSDGQNIETFGSFGGRQALQRGFNVMLFEGPGQMAPLFLDNIPFRPDWEKVVTPIVDYLVARPDVKPNQIGLVGISFAGLLAARAAAFEPRLRALALVPALIRSASIWGDQKSLTTVTECLKLPADGQNECRTKLNSGFVDDWGEMPVSAKFTVLKRGEIYSNTFHSDALAGRPPTDYFGLLESMLRFDVADVIPKISAPTLVTMNEGDASFANSPKELYDMLKVEKDFVEFTAANGAQYHDQPMAPLFANEVVLDWMAKHMAS